MMVWLLWHHEVEYSEVLGVFDNEAAAGEALKLEKKHDRPRRHTDFSTESVDVRHSAEGWETMKW